MIRFEHDGGQWQLSGAWTLAEVGAVAATMREAATARAGSGGDLRLDLDGISAIDGAGVVLIMEAWDTVSAAGGTVRSHGANAEVGDLIALYRQRRSPPPQAAPANPSALASIGRAAVTLAQGLRDGLAFFGAFCASLPATLRAPRTVPWRDVPGLIQRSGADGMSIVILTNLLIGAIIGFQGVMQLARFGAESLVPAMVVISHVRELGPIMTAIIVAGRSGAGFAAELGTMQVSEETDALRTMGFDPMRFLVLPRTLALCISLPLLTLLGNAVGLLGGMLAALPMMDSMTVPAYLSATGEALTFNHFCAGMSKPLVFALTISALACAQGLAARGGAAAVGTRTTSAVVFAIFSVIMVDSVFAIAFTMAGI
ncbi:MAG: ABC transporter permease [Planctomycetota bacterium]